MSESILLHCENTDFIALSDVNFCFILVFGLFDVKVLYRVFFVLCQSVLSSGFHDITVLDLPANMPDLNLIWNIWDIFRRKMRNRGYNNTDELKAQ